MKRIDGRARTVRELLHGARYTIDFYQREYAWQERQVRELVDDLTGKFLDFYDESHARQQVGEYGHYFLGSIVISLKQGKRFIVDGQQRLTTLTLLLIYLHHLQADRTDKVEIRTLIFSERYGQKSFNLDVPERAEVMRCLFDQDMIDLDTATESVANIAERYDTIQEHFPEELTRDALPYFVDWLLENVHLVEIEAYSDDDAYTIFETMNDRGLSLSLPEMLKGYVLANIRYENDQRQVNTLWKEHMQTLRALSEEEDVDFFKNWLRARYAETIRPGQKGAENRDYERIGSEFHRWVRDRREQLALTDSDAFKRFVTRDLHFYARQTLKIRQAARTLTPGLEAIRYNEERGFTLQTQLLLASLEPTDSKDVVNAKLKLVANFLDIWLARRVWCFRTIAYSSVKYTLFTLTREIRGRNLDEAATFLQRTLDEQPERFALEPRFRLHQQNYHQVRHILARLTHWLEEQCGLASHFEDLISQGRAKPFEIEHIWPDRYERFASECSSQGEFETQRNLLGGLLLLQRGVNQSLSDLPYEAKRDAYAAHSQNLLARSLHPMAYINNPAFTAFAARTGLLFRSFEHFGLEAQLERQVLYIRMAEWVWNPSRLNLDGERPPAHDPIKVEATQAPKTPPGPEPFRVVERREFWRELLEHAGRRTTLFSRVNPSRDSWLGTGAGKTGISYNFVVKQAGTRVELYINTLDRELNKAYFDKLFEQRTAIDAAFGEKLVWQRLNDKNTCRISHELILGGWTNRSTWSQAIAATVDAMLRLHAALHPHVQRLESEGLGGSAAL